VFPSKDPTGAFVRKGFDPLLVTTRRGTSAKSLSINVRITGPPPSDWDFQSD